MKKADWKVTLYIKVSLVKYINAANNEQYFNSLY